MIPAAFEYERATSVQHASELPGRFGEDAKVLAGGPRRIPRTRLRTPEPAAPACLNGDQAPHAIHVRRRHCRPHGPPHRAPPPPPTEVLARHEAGPPRPRVGHGRGREPGGGQPPNDAIGRFVLRRGNETPDLMAQTLGRSSVEENL